jgi:allantoate deiminase
MKLRQDALCAAAEFVLAVERLARRSTGLVATVGQIQVAPGASNVIPAQAELTLDVRHQKDSVRLKAVASLRDVAREIAAARGSKRQWQVVQETASVPCAPKLSALLKRAVQKCQKRAVELPSGAGHDAAIMARMTPAAMLFVRCKNGLSHHPAESVKERDVQIALEVFTEFLQLLAEAQEKTAKTRQHAARCVKSSL